MPILTFPLSANQRSIFSSNPSATGDAFGAATTNSTPAGWPTIGAVTALELDVTSNTTPDLDGNFLSSVSQGSNLTPLPGVWTGPGEMGAFFVPYSKPAFAWDSWGGWLTDYLTVLASTNAKSRVETQLAVADDPATATFDARVRVRTNSWAGPGTGMKILAGTGQNGWRFGVNTLDEFQVQIRMVRTDNSAQNTRTLTFTAPTLSTVDPVWVRMTYDPANSNRVRLFVSSDGASWSELTLLTGSFNAADVAVGVSGFVILNSNPAFGGSGFGGDYSDFLYYVNGTLRQSLSLETMAAQFSTTWTPAVGAEWSRGSDVDVVGAGIPELATARFDLSDPVEASQFRLNTHEYQTGSFTISEVRLWLRGRGPRLGLYR